MKRSRHEYSPARSVRRLDGSFPSEWITVSEYTSIQPDEYYPNVQIKDFCGYPFVYHSNSFIIDQINGIFEPNLKVLYDEIPKLLNEEFDEEALPV